MERIARRWKSLSQEEVRRIRNASSVEQYATGGLAGGQYMPAYTGALAGKAVTLNFEGREALHYRFEDAHALAWQDGAGGEGREFYQAHVGAQNVYFVHHAVEGTLEGRTLVLDFDTGLVTLCAARIGNGYEAREVGHTFYFGRIAGVGDGKAPLHGFTHDLVGKAIRWTYRENEMMVKHVYLTPQYYAYTMIGGLNGWTSATPADYVKIRENLYIFTWLEERQAGIEGICLIDLEAMHDVGGFFGINSGDTFECYTFGAKGEWSTPHTDFED